MELIEINMADAPSAPGEPGDITRLLQRWQAGETHALPAIVERTYAYLRRAAAQHMAGERNDHTLQTTALVNEVYLCLLADGADLPFPNRACFLGFASYLMRRVLVAYARARCRRKRGGDQVRAIGVILEDLPWQPTLDAETLIGVDEALTKLAAMDERLCSIVTLRYFGGLTQGETAQALGLSLSTVEKEWRLARRWLSGLLRR